MTSSCLPSLRRRCAAAAATLSALVVLGVSTPAAQAGTLSPNFFDPSYNTSCAPDLLGQLLCRAMGSSIGTLQQDQGAFMAASFYSVSAPGATYPGAFGEMDKCARMVTSSAAMGAFRFAGAAACLLTNPDLKNRVSQQVTQPATAFYY